MIFMRLKYFETLLNYHTKMTETISKQIIEPLKKINKDIIFLVPNINTKSTTKQNYQTEKMIILSTFSIAITVAIILNIQRFKRIILLSYSFNHTNGTDESILLYLNETDHFCYLINNTNFSLISHPLAFLIVIIYMFLFWRRSFGINYCFRRPAMPMIIPPYQKYNRFNTALVYGIIASSIIKMIFKELTQSSNSDWIYWNVNDPTGILSLLIKSKDVFIAALRYYPILIAFHSNSFIIFIVTALFVVVDFSCEIYQLGNYFFFSFLIEKDST